MSDGDGDGTAAPTRPARGVVVPADLVDRDRLEEDLALLAQLGVDEVRIGLDWPWLQPRAGDLHGGAVERYLGALRAGRELGLTVHLGLLERSVPAWFDDEGGFGDDRFALHHWPWWVEACAEAFGDLAGGWVPIEHPLGLANSLVRDDPRKHGEVLDTLVTAWRDAWRILRGGPPVVTAFGVEVVRAVDQTVQAAAAARRIDQLRWRLWFRALHDGIVTIPGRADREVADLAGSCDVVGIVVRHPADALGLLHRTAEMAPERPLAVTLLLPDGLDRDRDPAMERYLAETDEAAAGLDLASVAINPAFDPTAAGQPARGIITRDRELKDSGRRFLGLDG